MPDRVVCQWCDGGGEANNPGNADPTRPLSEWLPPVICPRCGGTGKDPLPRCARDSDWCDGLICHEVGFAPHCPRADRKDED